jgi:DNA-binding CsgD family transcriptional regulator
MLSGGQRTVWLSDREFQCLMHLARGLSNRRLAEELSVSEGTVRRHLAHAYQKMGVHSRQEAVARGVSEGWIAYEDLMPGGKPSVEDRARYRCAVEGCGCEIVVVQASRDGDLWRPPVCHGREMEPLR